MLNPIKSYDFICFQLRNNLQVQLENPLKKDIVQLSADISKLLTTADTILPLSFGLLERLFNLRIRTIQSFSGESDFNYFYLLSDATNRIEAVQVDPKLNVLKENILFALRCNQKIVQSIMGDGDRIRKSELDFKNLPEINYNLFLASLALGLPDDETAQKITDRINASLQIEFVVLAADIIWNDKIMVSEKIINELAFMVANAAQDYVALATEFGIVKTRKNAAFRNSQDFDDRFLTEQKAIAEIGLDDFNSLINNQ